MERTTPPPSVSGAQNRRGLFPDNEPFATGYLTTGGPHEVFYEECGTPHGKPCVILHGGPGGAINPTMRRFFNPEKWRMALFDQRGCGKSRPNASLDDNTTWALIDDIERLREHLGVGDDETTPDGKVSLEHVECNAACDYAPVVMVNWEFFDNMTPDTARDLVDGLRSGADITLARGPDHLCTWREASRILAGFPDGRAAQGPQAGPASLVGLEIAKEHGWTAPAPAATSSEEGGK